MLALLLLDHLLLVIREINDLLELDLLLWFGSLRSGVEFGTISESNPVALNGSDSFSIGEHRMLWVDRVVVVG